MQQMFTKNLEQLVTRLWKRRLILDCEETVEQNL